MVKKKNITDQVFGNSLKQYNEAPPEEVWLGISGVLAEDRKKTRMALMGRIAAAAVIVIAAGSIWVLVQRKPDLQVSEQGTEILTQPGPMKTVDAETPAEGVKTQEVELTPSGEELASEVKRKEAELVLKIEDAILIAEREDRETVDEIMVEDNSAFGGWQASDQDLRMYSLGTSVYAILVNAPNTDLIIADRSAIMVPVSE